MYKFLFIFSFLVFVSCDKSDDNQSVVSDLKDINSLSDYENEIKSGVSLIFYHASWCTICKAQRPAVEALSKDDVLKSVKFRQVDTDKNKDITTKFNVSGQPVIIVYKNGKEEKRLIGSGHSQQKLTDILKALL